MACFIVPMIQAVAVTAVRLHSEKKFGKTPVEASAFRKGLPALEKLLWGGTLMLVVDHIISGELTWMFPFFSNLKVEGGLATMLEEMLTVGVPMSAVVTAAWAVAVLVKARIASRSGNTSKVS